MHNFSTCVSTSRIYWQQNSKPALSSAIVNICLYHLWCYRDSIEAGLVHPPPPAHAPARTPPLLAHSNRFLSSQSGIFVPSRNYINFLCNSLWIRVSTVGQKLEKTKSIFSDWSWCTTQYLHLISFTAWFISQTFWFWPSKTDQAGGKLRHWLYMKVPGGVRGGSSATET